MTEQAVRDFCSNHDPSDWEHLSASSVAFLQSLGLPSRHPFCADKVVDEPPGTTIHDTSSDCDSWMQVVTLGGDGPAVLELYLRVLALWIAVLGVLCLLPFDNIGRFWWKKRKNGSSTVTQPGGAVRTVLTPFHCSSSCTILVQLKDMMLILPCVCAAMVVMTDSQYVMELGLVFTRALFGLVLALTMRRGSGNVGWMGMVVVVLFIMVRQPCQFQKDETNYFSEEGKQLPQVEEGFYYDANTNNGTSTFVGRLVHHWPAYFRDYTTTTPWLSTGDARTGIPFLLSTIDRPPMTRVFLTLNDGESLALDIVFPDTGYDTTRPVFLLFTGLVGGSDSKYVQDLSWRGREAGSTIITVIHRGHMDLPLRYGQTFHTARLDDLHHVCRTIRDALDTMAQQRTKPPLVAVGYSAGASMLATYLVQYGKDAAVDAALAFSGSLDLKFCAYDQRSQRIWQNVFATEGRSIYLDKMEPDRVQRRLDDASELRRLYHKKYPTFHEIIQLVAGLNGYRNTDHYIEQSTALGDLTLHDYSMQRLPANKRIHNLSVPLVIVNSLDDPISPWRSVVSNHGAMHPAHLTQTGSGRLMMLITRRGGHVSWPVGWDPTQQKWSWMSHLALSFAQAFVLAETASTP